MSCHVQSRSPISILKFRELVWNSCLAVSSLPHPTSLRNFSDSNPKPLVKYCNVRGNWPIMSVDIFMCCSSLHFSHLGGCSWRVPVLLWMTSKSSAWSQALSSRGESAAVLKMKLEILLRWDVNFMQWSFQMGSLSRLSSIVFHTDFYLEYPQIPDSCHI